MTWTFHYSDCPPLEDGCVRTPFYHEENHYGFFANCPTSFYNQPLSLFVFFLRIINSHSTIRDLV